MTLGFWLACALTAAASSLGLSLWTIVRIAKHLKHPTTRKLASLDESMSELLEGFERLNARDKMRAVRSGAKYSAQKNDPDPYTQPNEWKAFKREQLGINIAKGKGSG
jgi:hypothetical protein